MHSSQSIHRASHTCLALATETPDGRYYPRITIHQGGSIREPIIHQAEFPNLLFIQESHARHAGAEYIDNWLHGWTVQGAHKRAQSEVTYGYAAKIGLGPRVSWEAKIYRDGSFMGTVTGVYLGDHSTSLALESVVRNLVESSIDLGAGFQL